MYKVLYCNFVVGDDTLAVLPPVIFSLKERIEDRGVVRSAKNRIPLGKKSLLSDRQSIISLCDKIPIVKEYKSLRKLTDGRDSL